MSTPSLYNQPTFQHYSTLSLARYAHNLAVEIRQLNSNFGTPKNGKQNVNAILVNHWTPQIHFEIIQIYWNFSSLRDICLSHCSVYALPE